ncbi:MAG TPA: aromatic ring-hydroxylating dioxygenase subunit alpha [Caulobacteraceae bacterium]|nr:aromatic ring-hydroxylating dioxygenase subunit alpha [Caulobacteraceae bacterium]
MSDVAAHSLPAWIYSDPGYFALERQRVFRQAWQVVCHLSDIPGPGDFHTLDFLDELVVTVRGEDGQVRSFHNVCRHRAARVVDGDKGNCGRRMVCPYHAWSYGLDGRLIRTPAWQDFEGLDPVQHGLAPVEQEIFAGFVFVRFAPGLPSVAEMMAAYAPELAAHRFEDLVPLGRVTLRPRAVNWKNIGDNYSDALHIPVAHPGLSRLFAGSYRMEARDWVEKLWGDITEKPSPNLVERAYQALLPVFDHLPEADRRRWSYYKLWPNIAFDVYPDQVDFMQWIPVSPTTSVIREIAYVLPDERREAKAARYLNWRINRQVNAEDTALIARVQAGMASSSYRTGPLARGEIGLTAFAERLTRFIPETFDEAPLRAVRQ